MMKVRRKSDGHVYGGWAAEYAGHATSVKCKEVLYGDMEVVSLLCKCKHSTMVTTLGDLMGSQQCFYSFSNVHASCLATVPSMVPKQ
jgi:hypothetical protein